MTTAVDIKRGDEVSFTPNPRFRSNLREVDNLAVFDVIRDDTTTVLTFSINDSRDQIMLPNIHPVTIHCRAR